MTNPLRWSAIAENVSSPVAIASGSSGVWVANEGDGTVDRIDAVTGDVPRRARVILWASRKPRATPSLIEFAGFATGETADSEARMGRWGAAAPRGLDGWCCANYGVAVQRRGLALGAVVYGLGSRVALRPDDPRSSRAAKEERHEIQKE